MEIYETQDNHMKNDDSMRYWSIESDVKDDNKKKKLYQEVVDK